MTLPKIENLSDAIELATYLDQWIQEQDVDEYKASDSKTANQLWDKLDDAKTSASNFEDEINEYHDDEEEEEEIPEDTDDDE